MASDKDSSSAQRDCGHLTATGKTCVKEISEPSWWCGMRKHPPNPPEFVSSNIGFLAVMFWLDDCVGEMNNWEMLSSADQVSLTDAMSSKLFDDDMLSRSIADLMELPQCGLSPAESVLAIAGGYRKSQSNGNLSAKKPLKASASTEEAAKWAQKHHSKLLAEELAREAYSVGLLTVGKHSNLSLWSSAQINDIPLRGLLMVTGARHVGLDL